jgi:hypothetical protein
MLSQTPTGVLIFPNVAEYDPFTKAAIAKAAVLRQRLERSPAYHRRPEQLLKRWHWIIYDCAPQ